MDLNDTPELAEYRATGPRLARRAHVGGADRSRRRARPAATWQRKLAEGGLAAVTWPADYGGQGLGPLQPGGRQPGDRARRRAGDLRRHRRRDARPDDDRPRQRGAEAALPRPDADRRRGLVPAVLRARRGLRPRRHPDARARSRTTARWRLSGQKVWTTNAQYATYGLLLARTDADVPKHKGLTMFIVPMDARRRDDPAAAPDLRRGALQRGVLRRRRARRRAARSGRSTAAGASALTTLMFERVAIGLGGEGFGWRADRFAEALLEDAAAARRHGGPPPLRRDRGRLPRAALHRLPDAHDAPARRHPRPRGRAGQGHDDQGGDRGGRAAGRRARARRRSSDDRWGELVSDLPGLKSAGGTEEILRNMVGERVLGLPPEPRLDKGIPFSELRAKERRGRSHELRADRRAGVPQGGGARRAVALQDRRGRPRGARRRRAARPVADRGRGRLARPADLRGAPAAPASA